MGGLCGPSPKSTRAQSRDRDGPEFKTKRSTDVDQVPLPNSGRHLGLCCRSGRRKHSKLTESAAAITADAEQLKKLNHNPPPASGIGAKCRCTWWRRAGVETSTIRSTWLFQLMRAAKPNWTVVRDRTHRPRHPGHARALKSLSGTSCATPPTDLSELVFETAP